MPATDSLDVTKAWESQRFEHDRPLLCCAFSPCGKYIMAGAQDENLLRWELDSGSKTVLRGHASWVHAVAFHPNQQHVLSGDLHGSLRCWDYTTAEPKPLWTVEAAHASWIQTVVVTPDGKLCITTGTDGAVRLWNTADGHSAGELSGHDTEVYSVAVHPDGNQVATGDLQGRIFIWNLQSRSHARTLDASLLHTRKPDFLADVGGVRSLTFNVDGSLLAAGGMSDAESNAFCPGKPAVLVFDFATGGLTRTLRPKEKSDGPIKGLAFLAGDVLAAQGEHLNATSSLEFFSPDAAESRHAVKRESGYGLSLHPDGLQLAVASFVANGRGGNGRHAEPQEYVSHNGAVVIYRLHPKPT